MIKVERRLQAELPGIIFETGPTGCRWGFWNLGVFRLEISLGKTDELDHLFIAVRGNVAESFRC